MEVMLFYWRAIMVIMNLHLDNFLIFNDFALCMSYPKKIVRSSIEDEHLAGRERFRYKKVIVLMGANATGKTALGRVLMSMFNFIDNKEYSGIVKLIRIVQLSFGTVRLLIPTYCQAERWTGLE